MLPVKIQPWSDTPARGDTWKLIGGTYGAKDFTTAASGATWINFARVTSAEAAVAGYATYMTTQIVSVAPWNINAPYLTFSGMGRDESNPPLSWTNQTYGITVHHNGQSKIFNYLRNAQHVWMTNVWGVHDPVLNTNGGDYIFNCWETGYDDDVGNPLGLATSNYRTNLVWDSCGGIYGQNAWFLAPSIDPIITRCAHLLGHGNSGEGSLAHGEVFNAYWHIIRMQISYSLLMDEYLGGGCTALIVTVEASRGHKIWGCVFWKFKAGNGIFGFAGGPTSGCLFVHNTVVDHLEGAGGVNLGPSSDGFNNEVRNNLWYRYASAYMSSISNLTHNAFSSLPGDGARDIGTSAQTTITSGYFSNYAGGDFRLAIPTDLAVDVGAPYNIDMFGNVNTNRGAFGWQSSAASEPAPAAPTIRIQNLRVTTLRIQ